MKYELLRTEYEGTMPICWSYHLEVEAVRLVKKLRRTIQASKFMKSPRWSEIWGKFKMFQRCLENFDGLVQCNDS